MLKNSVIAVIIVFAAVLMGCGAAQNGENNGNAAGLRDKAAELSVDNVDTSGVAMPESPKTDAASEGGYVIDLSNAAKGYVCVSAESVPEVKTKVQIKKDDETYNYDFTGEGDFETYPLQMGDGAYSIGVYENLSGNSYAQAAFTEADVKIENEFAPYLVPNQFVDYTRDSKAVAAAIALCEGQTGGLGEVDAIYGYIVDNVVYDTPKAENLVSGYLPDVDDTLDTNKGICFDYAALTACMLRSVGIPTRLVTGYVSGQDIYHAWNEIYLEEVGWVRTDIYFDGENWQTADTTFAAGGGQNAAFIGDGTGYSPVGLY